MKTTRTSLELGQEIGNWRVIALNYYHPSCAEPHLLLKCKCGKLQPQPKRVILSGRPASCGCQKIKKPKSSSLISRPKSIRR